MLSFSKMDVSISPLIRENLTYFSIPLSLPSLLHWYYLDYYFSNFKVHWNHLDILLKFKVCFSRLWVGPQFLHFEQAQVRLMLLVPQLGIKPASEVWEFTGGGSANELSCAGPNYFLSYLHIWMTALLNIKF